MSEPAPRRRFRSALWVTLLGVTVILLGTLLFGLLGGKTTELTGSQPGGVGVGLMANESLFLLVTLLGLHSLHNPPHLGPVWKSLIWGTAGGAALLLADLALSLLARKLGFGLGMESIFLPEDPTDLAIWACALLLAPLGEEGFFRGLLPALYERSDVNAVTSAFLCCAMFGLIHGGQQPAAIAVAFLLGFGFIALKRASGGLLAPMIAHFIVDAAGLWIMLHSPHAAG